MLLVNQTHFKTLKKFYILFRVELVKKVIKAIEEKRYVLKCLMLLVQLACSRDGLLLMRDLFQLSLLLVSKKLRSCYTIMNWNCHILFCENLQSIQNCSHAMKLFKIQTFLITLDEKE